MFRSISEFFTARIPSRARIKRERERKAKEDKSEMENKGNKTKTGEEKVAPLRVYECPCLYLCARIQLVALDYVFLWLVNNYGPKKEN